MAIAGFVIGGQATQGLQNVLIRASGPALAQFGLSGLLEDPSVLLDSPDFGDIDSNADWGGNPDIANAAAAVGAFAWTDPDSIDAALDEVLSPGAYTAQVSGTSGDSGLSLVEIYDATPPGSYVPTTPRLINISARAQVGTGSNVLIAGFVIGGSTAKTVLIRASGPALGQFGLTGTLQDPTLELVGSAGVIATNGTWGGQAEIAAAAAGVGAFAWSDPASRDAAILITLPPGSYTAVLSGAGGDSGLALIEIYDVQ